MITLDGLLVLGIWPLNTIGGPEWIIIGIAAVLLFGRKLPDLGRSLGRTLIEFKRGLHGMKEEIEKAGDEPPPAPAAEVQPSPEAAPSVQPNSAAGSAESLPAENAESVSADAKKEGGTS